jgi:hypothetical protein
MFRSLDEVTRVIRNRMRSSDARPLGDGARARERFTPAVHGQQPTINLSQGRGFPPAPPRLGSAMRAAIAGRTIRSSRAALRRRPQTVPKQSTVVRQREAVVAASRARRMGAMASSLIERWAILTTAI